MWSNYLKLALRNLRKNKTYVIINIVGMGISIACCIVAFLNWQYNTEFDQVHQKIDEIYRVNFVRMTDGDPVKNGSSPAALGKTVATQVPHVDHVIRYYPLGGNFRVGDQLFQVDLAAVDPAMLEVFTFSSLYGDFASLADERTIVISEDVQKKHFGDGINPVGETFTYLRGDKLIDFQVGGVFETPPQNSSFQHIEAYIPYSHVESLDGVREDDWAEFNNTFLHITDPALVEQVEEQLQQYVGIQNQAKKDYRVDHYYLDPLQGMAVRSEKERIWNHWLTQSLPSAAALAPAIMSFLILLLACFNFTNTSIAVANRRIKEIGMRKVLGSTQRQIIYQFMGENMLLALLALIFGILFALWLVPAYSSMWVFLDIKLRLFSNPGLWVFLITLLLSTAIIAGSYPSFYISRFKPDSIFRGSVKFSGTNSFTRILLLFQFALSTVAIGCGILFAQNAIYQQNYDMGFQSQTCLTAYIPGGESYITFSNRLRTHSEIESIGGSRSAIGRSWYYDPVRVDAKEMDVYALDVTAEYLETVGASIIEGRNFHPESQSDHESAVIINQFMAERLNWDDPVGKTFSMYDTLQLTVVGVVRDIFYNGGLWEPMEPMILRNTLPDDYRFLTVRTEMDQVAQVKEIMDREWKSVFPDQISTVSLMDESMAESNEINSNIKTLFLFLASLATILSMVGLYSLLSLNLKKRKKEIGVRKILGASTIKLSLRISKEFIFVLLIACILGSLATSYMGTGLMSSIWAYYMPAHWNIYLSSSLLLLILGGTLLILKTLRAAQSNPAQVIREE